MTKITKKGLKEEIDAITRYCYVLHHEKFLEFCEKERKGKQSFEELNMLVTSLTDENPWRIILTKTQTQSISQSVLDAKKNMTKIIESIEIVLDDNEIVSGDA